MSQSTSSSHDTFDARTLLVRDVQGQYRCATAEEVLAHARRFLAYRVRRGAAMTSPSVVKDYLRFQIGHLEHEVFGALMLDTQHRIIQFKVLFRGSVSQTSIYPREVVKEVLAVNAAAVLLAHNHPSGSAEPSRADEFLTRTLKDSLSMVDVRVLDHLVVSATDIVSFAERGLL